MSIIETFGDLEELGLDLPENIKINELNWVKYNPRKDINRYGASITSLDGKMDGVPDLDSVYEYNILNNTDFREKDFQIMTSQGQIFKYITDKFDLGRSHFIKLGKGGFFPYHRDLDLNTFRIIYTIQGCEYNSLVWIINDKVYKLNNNCWYIVNTKKIHSVFSFDESVFAVFNVINNSKALNSIVHNLKTK